MGKTSTMSEVEKLSFAGTALGAARGRFPLVESALAGFHEHGRREEPKGSNGRVIQDRPVAKEGQLAARQLGFEGGGQ
jgi:hypothetical protein